MGWGKKTEQKGQKIGPTDAPVRDPKTHKTPRKQKARACTALRYGRNPLGTALYMHPNLTPIASRKSPPRERGGNRRYVALW